MDRQAAREHQGFRCPECSGPTGCTDSRPSKTFNQTATRRRRRCRRCGFMFTTYEMLSPGRSINQNFLSALRAARDAREAMNIFIAELTRTDERQEEAAE